MINDPLVEVKDKLWWDVDVAARIGSIKREAGSLRDLHAEMYDTAKTERKCIELRDRGLIEVARLAALPKEPTLEEQVATMRKEIDELKEIDGIKNKS